MESYNSDVWGLFKHEKCKDTDEHLQSYFIAMTKKVFLHKEFEAFIASVKKEKSKEDIIKKYEVNLSVLFRKLGFSIASLLDSSIKTNNEPNVVGSSAFAALKHHFPFLKINLFKAKKFSKNEMKRIFKLIEPYYDENYILKHLDRILTQDEKQGFFKQFSIFEYALKDKVRFYSQYSNRSGKYQIILFILNKKIFTLSLPAKKLYAFDEFKNQKN